MIPNPAFGPHEQKKGPEFFSCVCTSHGLVIMYKGESGIYPINCYLGSITSYQKCNSKSLSFPTKQAHLPVNELCIKYNC